MRNWWLVLFLVGCPTDDSSPQEGEVDADTDADADTDTDTDGDTDSDTDTDMDTDTDTDSGLGDVTNVSGVISTASGAGVQDAQIRFCRDELCLNGTTDAMGAFNFTDVQAFPHSFEVIGPQGSGLATGFSVVTLEADVPKSLSMTLLPLGPASALGSSTSSHEVGDGLHVDLALGDLETPPFLPDATEVAGVFVPPGDYPTIDGLNNVIALWYTAPFDYHAPAGVPFQIDNNFGLAEGGTYEVYVGDYESSTWLSAGTVTNTGGVLSGSGTLPLMSAVALTEVQ